MNSLKPLGPVNLDGRIFVRDFSRITVVTIKRPVAHNAMTTRMWQELSNIGRKIAVNPNTRVVILRGAFDYFTAGSDIKEFSRMSIEQVDETFTLMEEAISTFEQLPIPTIACIKGSAMGAGLQLALACDLRVAAENAQLGMPIAKLGITIGTPFARRLVDLIGPSRTKDLLLTGRILSVQEAMQLGMVNYNTPMGKVENFALRLAKTVANQSPASTRNSKQAVAQCCAQRDSSWRVDSNPYWVDPKDFREGVTAFLEKRVPDFRHK
ncbi:MAG: enoyl-CoA hydratase-related protein [Carboxydocellales bacterium]